MAHGTTGDIWPDGIIPYEIDSDDFPVDSTVRNNVEEAIEHWNDNTVIRLIPRSDEDDYIVFQDTGTNCASGVGRRGGRQTLTCDLEGGGFSSGSIIHEIGHVVGLHHEHTRPDRATFVTVGDNSDSGNCDIIFGERMLTDYDCNSIMHYPASACGTITPVGGGCGSMGQRDALSGRDVWGVSVLYKVRMRAVVVWSDDSDDNNLFQVHASGFAETGSRCCGPMTVNRFAANQQWGITAAMSRSGDMIFVWHDDTDGNGFFQIKMRGFGPDGHQRISQRTVNTAASGNQLAPHVAVNETGRFVVVWQDDTDGNGFYQIKVRGFYSDGSESFSQRTVNTVASGQQRAPRVAIAPEGSFVVVWEDDQNTSGRPDIFMRGFFPDGSERWSQRRVNSRNEGRHRSPRVALSPFGDFVVVWADDSDLNGVFQIRMRAFNYAGNEKFSERTVNQTAAGQQVEPDVAVDDLFRPVVVWADDRDRNNVFQIRMRGFESDGSQRISERTVNTDCDGQQRRPAIGMQGDGLLTVAWEDDSDGDGVAEDILVRGFSANGQERFTTRMASNLKGGRKRSPCVVAPAMSWLDPLTPPF